MIRSTVPRTRAGISSSIAELMAAYSPPMPAPVKKRQTANTGRRRERRRDGGHQVDRQGHHEQLLAAEPVGEVAEEQRAEAGAGDVDRGGLADLALGDARARSPSRSGGGDRADDRHLEAVEDPDRAEADDHQPVPARPGQPVQPGRDVGLDDATLESSASDVPPPRLSPRPGRAWCRPRRRLLAKLRACALGVGAGFADGRLVPGDVEVRGGADRRRRPRARAAAAGYAAPGFVDLQVNGHAGVDLHAGRAGRGRARASSTPRSPAAGTTAWRPTLHHRARGGADPARCGGRPEPVTARGRWARTSRARSSRSPSAAARTPPEHLRLPDLDAAPAGSSTPGPSRRSTLGARAAPAPRALDRRAPPPAASPIAAGHTAAAEEQAWRAFDRRRPHRRPPPQRDGARAVAAAALAHLRRRRSS